MPDPQGFKIGLVVSAGELLEMQFVPREELIDGILFTQSLAMVFASRGTGKTYLTLSMANSIASGKDFLCWKIPKARRCLYVDGELPAADLQERVKQICGSQPPSLLEFISSEHFYDLQEQPLTLNNADDQDKFLSLLDQLEVQGRKPEVIIFDNLSSLTYGMDENSNSDQDPFLRFLLKLRHRGHTVIFVHHTGKNNAQRGASRREDLLDISIQLEPWKSKEGDVGFTLQFSKMRRKVPAVSKLVCELIEDKDGRLKLCWEPDCKSLEDRSIAKHIQCLHFIEDRKPKTQKEIAQEFKVQEGTVSKWVKKLQKNGLLKKLEVTLQGTKCLDEEFGERVSKGRKSA